MVVTDVFGQTQVVQLREAQGQGGRSPGPRLPPHTVPSRVHPAPRLLPRTSGSPVSWLVWIRMVPMRTSLHTARSAGSMVSPARRMDTPVIWGEGGVLLGQTPPHPPPSPQAQRVPASQHSTCPRSPALVGSAPHSPVHRAGGGHEHKEPPRSWHPPHSTRSTPGRAGRRARAR